MRDPRSMHALLPASLLAAAALFLTPQLASASPSPSASTAAQTTWTDSFSRTADNGWGDGYLSSPSYVASVADDSGRIRVSGGQRTIHESTVAQSTDGVIGATLSFSALPTNGNGATAIVTSRNGAAGSYGARFRLDTQSRGVISIARFDADDVQTMLRQDYLLIDEVPQNAQIRLEIETTGADDVRVRARAWIVGSPQPDWQVSTTDRSDQAITTPGTPGIQTYMSRGNRSMYLRVDDLTVDSPDLQQIPSPEETVEPSPVPTVEPSPAPTVEPTVEPTPVPTVEPTVEPTPVPTVEPTTAPSNPPAPPVTPPAGGATAGSTAVGQTTYAAPADAVYVVPAGSRSSGSGTRTDPVAGAQRAIDIAPNGATLVLRTGTYHESLSVPFFKKLTIQSAAGEAVWLDGAQPVAGWVRSGDTWSAPWSTFFDSRVSFSVNQDETSWWVNNANPLAGHPDQVWLDGGRLAQVGSRSAVTAGTFFVDQSAHQLVIGSDPSGRAVEASTLAKALKIQGAGTTVRGIGVQRYATTTALMGAVSAEVDGITLENMVIRDNATVGLFAWNDDKTFRNLTVTGNGLLGIGVNAAKNLTIENSVVAGNNVSKFNYAPVAGGVKISRGTDVKVRNNVISDNVGSTGLWFDVSSSNLTVAGNVLEGNGREGLEIELSQTATVAGNYIVGNLNSGVFVFDAGDVDIWNNTMTGNGRTITYMQDERRQEVSSLSSLIPWITSDVVVRNNVLSYGGQACPILSQDLTSRWFGNDFGISQDANLYHRASASSPTNFACWAAGSSGTRGITSIEEFRSVTGGDAKSVLVQGAPVVDPGSWQLTAASPVTAAYPLPSNIATALGVSAQTSAIGAPLPPVSAR